MSTAGETLDQLPKTGVDPAFTLHGVEVIVSQVTGCKDRSITPLRVSASLIQIPYYSEIRAM